MSNSNDNQDRQALSINRFRDVDITSLSKEEYRDYVLAKLLQDMINRLEACIHNDRIFSRTKFDVMSLVWEARALLHNREKS